MVLVDTSVWIDHFRKTSSRLVEYLTDNKVSIHPFVIGELACGNLNNRKHILSLMHALPAVQRVEDHEVLFFIEQHALYGRGLGFIDTHLLSSCKMSGHDFWTRDKRLKDCAAEHGIRLVH